MCSPVERTPPPLPPPAQGAFDTAMLKNVGGWTMTCIEQRGDA